MKRYSKKEIKEMLKSGAGDSQKKIAVLQFMCEQLLSDNEEMEAVLEYYSQEIEQHNKEFAKYVTTASSIRLLIRDNLAKDVLAKIRGERED